MNNPDNMESSGFDEYLQEGKEITLDGEQGIVGEVFEDHFVFLVQSHQNDFEHYSNLSEPPQYRRIYVQKKDIKRISFT
jgi:hypothetical protein